MIFIHKFKDNTLDFKLRYAIKDIGNTPDNNKEIFSNGRIKFDTGADITIFHATQIGLNNITENQFTYWIQTNDKVNSIQNGKINTKTLFGFSNAGIDNDAAIIKSYAYQVADFDLILDNGILHLGSVPITITFDDRFSQPLFGKDLMSLINAKINSDEHRLELELKEWMENKDTNIDGIYMMHNGYYQVDNLLHGALLESNQIISSNSLDTNNKKIDREVLESNYINQKIKDNK